MLRLLRITEVWAQGISALRAVQVIDLKPMEEQSPFSAVEGFEATPKDDDNP